MKAISSGKLSATRDSFGRWHIDPAELSRVYRIIETSNSNQKTELTGESTLTVKLQAELQAEKAMSEMLREQVTDLRTRIDLERTERVQAQAQVVALLQQQSAAPKSGFFAWLRRK